MIDNLRFWGQRYVFFSNYRCFYAKDDFFFALFMIIVYICSDFMSISEDHKSNATQVVSFEELCIVGPCRVRGSGEAIEACRIMGLDNQQLLF